VELPLALPVIIAGIRTATTICVGIATLAAFIGAGGLGDFINRGLATNNNQLILLGAIPAAIMALTIDGLIAYVEKTLSHRRTYKNWRNKKTAVVALVLSLFCLPILGKVVVDLDRTARPVIRIATKNFTEQVILGELMAEIIEGKTSLQVERRFNLGTTDIIHQALLKGEVDLYPEYTGTAYLTVLKHHGAKNSQLYDEVKKEYKNKFHLTWLSPFGFSNNQALTVTSELAHAKHIKTISELSAISNKLTMGAPAEFLEREDAYPGLRKTYGLHFNSIKSFDPGLLYKAINTHQIDAIMAFTTDARIKAHHLFVLNDDKHFFPPYIAAPVIRDSLLKQYPEVGDALALLANVLTDKKMGELNNQVDVEKHSVKSVAQKFLQQHHLLG